MRNKYAANHVLLRDGIFFYVRRVPLDLAEYYSVKRLCFSLRTKSYKSAIHASKSVSQRLEDYWLGLRLQKIDISAGRFLRCSIAFISNAKFDVNPANLSIILGYWTDTQLSNHNNHIAD